MEIDKAKLLAMYKSMVRIRAFEKRASKEFALGNIPGHIHLSVGQEAVAVGACANLVDGDYITSTHRGHGHVIAKGAKTDRMMAELFGKKDGYNKGKGGSMHIADIDIGIVGANGIVGAGIPIAVGAALAVKKSGTKQVCICFFGDGANNRGTFHEGLNMAAIWKLPVVFVLENNLYAETTPVDYHTSIANLSDRAVSYGIPGISVDGNNVIAVYEAVSTAVERARNGDGPSLVECKTYRLHGHFEGDPQKYKPGAEVSAWWEKEPIERSRKKFIEMGIMTDADVERIQIDIDEEIERAVEFATESPYPEPIETLDDVYA